MNSLASGLYAESLVIRGEDPAAFAELTAEYYAAFHPVNPRQRELVDTLVHNTWLIRRLRLTEADLYTEHFEERDRNFDPKSHHHHAHRAHPLSDSFACLEKSLHRLQSRVNSLERSSRAALKELDAAGAGLAEAAPADAETTEQSTTSADSTHPGPLQIGFAPSIGEAPFPTIAADPHVVPLATPSESFSIRRTGASPAMDTHGHG